MVGHNEVSVLKITWKLKDERELAVVSLERVC